MASSGLPGVLVRAERRTGVMTRARPPRKPRSAPVARTGLSVATVPICGAGGAGGWQGGRSATPTVQPHQLVAVPPFPTCCLLVSLPPATPGLPPSCHQPCRAPHLLQLRGVLQAQVGHQRLQLLGDGGRRRRAARRPLRVPQHWRACLVEGPPRLEDGPAGGGGEAQSGRILAGQWRLWCSLLRASLASMQLPAVGHAGRRPWAHFGRTGVCAAASCCS